VFVKNLFYHELQKKYAAVESCSVLVGPKDILCNGSNNRIKDLSAIVAEINTYIGLIGINGKYNFSAILGTLEA